MNEASRIREFEILTNERLSKLEDVRDNGAIMRNAQAMKSTIEEWNKMYIELDIRITTMENNVVNMLRTVKDIQDNNTLALQRIMGNGPTA